MDKLPAFFPFTQVVGQDDMKRALLLNIVDPGIGGVLIKGEKGTAKSTTVRSLNWILPYRRDARSTASSDVRTDTAHTVPRGSPRARSLRPRTSG